MNIFKECVCSISLVYFIILWFKSRHNSFCVSIYVCYIKHDNQMITGLSLYFMYIIWKTIIKCWPKKSNSNRFDLVFMYIIWRMWILDDENLTYKLTRPIYIGEGKINMGEDEKLRGLTFPKNTVMLSMFWKARFIVCWC